MGSDFAKRYWSKYFSSKIMARGFEYFQSDAVGELFLDSQMHTLTADVYGTDMYAVTIYFDDSNKVIEDMDCDCPYVLDGENCKHMAAVLFALEANGLPESDDSVTNTLKKAVQSLSEEEAKAYVLEYAQKDTKFRNQLLLHISDVITPQQKSSWKKKLKKIVCEDAYVYNDDWDYDDFYIFTNELSDFMEEIVPELIRKKLYADAFELVCDVYNEAHGSELYEENGYFSDLDQACMTYLEKIIPNADNAEKQKMYLCFSKTAVRDAYLDCLVDLFPEKEYLEEDLRIIDQQIQDHKNSEYALESLVVLRCEVMAELQLPDEMIRKFREPYRYLYAVRQQEAQQAIESDKPEDAIRIALEGKKTDKDSYEIANWIKMLIELYAQTKQTEKYREELLYYTLRYTQNDLQYVTRLKEVIPVSEWEFVRNQLLCSNSMQWKKCEFLYSEHMYRPLFEIAAAEYGTNLLFSYEDDFKAQYPEETRDVILKKLDIEMKDAHKRNHYASIVQRLCRVRSYPDGKMYANDMAESWVRQYNRRTAMKEELRNAGFPVFMKK